MVGWLLTEPECRPNNLNVNMEEDLELEAVS